MIQNIIALIIVFTTLIYAVFTVIRNITAEKPSKCGGCAGCSLKPLAGNMHKAKH